jgi:hypothetical protein
VIIVAIHDFLAFNALFDWGDYLQSAHSTRAGAEGSSLEQLLTDARHCA